METNCIKTCKTCTGPIRVKITTSLPKTTTTTTPKITTTRKPKTTTIIKTTTSAAKTKDSGHKIVPCKDTKHPSLVNVHSNFVRRK